MTAKTVVFAEVDGNRIRESAWEAIGLARSLGAEVATVVLGPASGEAAPRLAERGGGTVIPVEHPLLECYTAEAYTDALEQVAAKIGARLWLFPHSPMGWDLAPKLAARLGGACGTEVCRVEGDGPETVYVKKAFKGKFDMAFQLEGEPHVVTLQSGSQEAFQGSSQGEVEAFSPTLEEDSVRARFVEIREAERSAGAVDLTQSSVIVAGGRGLGGPEKFEIIAALAKALGGDVGASRPVTDAGWLPPDRQIGSSGVRVKPKLYIAAGISGAIQHLVGMKDSGYIIAINKDPKAPIFEVCDVGVVGDLFEIVPALTEAVAAAKG